MENELTLPETLQEAIVLFSDKAYAHRVAVSIVWPDGVPTCPHCKAQNANFMATYYRYRCRACRKDFTLKQGTIFEDSPLGMDKWMMAIWMISNCKNGISSYEVARDMGVCQKTAWFMLHRIREAMRTGSFKKMDGTIEADETYVGGLEKNKHENKKLHAGRGTVGKTIVMGVLERSDKAQKSRVRAGVIATNDKPTLSAIIKREVEEFATIYTDAHKGYNGLSEKFIHDFVDHAVCYAIGQVHTNGIENFWSLLKRSLKGTYISVEPFHLEAYINVQAFRFNERANTDGERFQKVLGQVGGKRLIFDALTSAYEDYYDQVMPK